MVWCQHLHYSIYYSTVNYGIIWFKKEICMNTSIWLVFSIHRTWLAPLPLEKKYLNDDLESFGRSRLVVVWAPLHFWHLFGRSKFSWYSYEKIGPYGITFSLHNYNRPLATIIITPVKEATVESCYHQSVVHWILSGCRKFILNSILIFLLPTFT